MPTMTCGTMLAHVLEAYGVRHVFGIPGVHNVELYRGLWQTRIRHVSPRHEQGAGFMADGYARVTGKPGVALVITGPGLTNIATPMGQAYGDSVPMLVLSAVNRRHELGLGRGFLHEMPNQRNLAAGVSAFAHTLMRPDELPDVMAAAFAVFSSARPRPVNIEFPLDIMVAKVDFDPGAFRIRPISRPGPEPSAIDAAAAILAKARRVIVIAGGGAAGAAAEVRQLCELLGAPLQTTTNGRGILPPEHPLNADLGITLDEGRAVMNGGDAVIAVGTETGETDYEYHASRPFHVDVPFIRIDIDPRQIAVGTPPTVAICSDAQLAVAALLQRLKEMKRVKPDAAWAQSTVKKLTACGNKSREPEDPLYHDLAATMCEATGDPILFADSTKAAYVAQINYRSPLPRSFACAGTGFGTLGYALPAAIGAKVACPDRPVTCLIGDGGLQFTLAELISAREAEAGIAVVVWNNESYREIRDDMVRKEIPPIAVDPIPPKFIELAASMGIKGVRVGSLSELADRLKVHGRDAKQPVLIETGPWITS